MPTCRPTVHRRFPVPTDNFFLSGRFVYLFWHIARAGASEDHSRALRASTDHIDPLIGVAQEADPVSPGFEQSTAISNHSTLDFTLHYDEQRIVLPGDASWKRLCSSSVPPDDDDDDLCTGKFARVCTARNNCANSVPQSYTDQPNSQYHSYAEPQPWTRLGPGLEFATHRALLATVHCVGYVREVNQ